MSSSGVHVLVSARADDLRGELARHKDDPMVAGRILVSIGREFYAALRSCCEPLAGHTPVFVLRGGLFMRDAFGLEGGATPVGVMVPHRLAHHQDPVMAYCCVPLTGPQLTVTDVLVASGRTMTACLRELSARLSARRHVAVATPFLSAVARRLILSEFPGIRIHTFWPDEQVDAAGRMVGPGFDVGDYSLGGPSQGFESWRAEVP